jgi:hypothetical protein
MILLATGADSVSIFHNRCILRGVPTEGALWSAPVSYPPGCSFIYVAASEIFRQEGVAGSNSGCKSPLLEGMGESAENDSLCLLTVMTA